MPIKKPTARDDGTMARINAVVPMELTLKLDEARALLRRQGVSVSFSSFVEIAVGELLARKDLAEVLKRRGATKKRA